MKIIVKNLPKTATEYDVIKLIGQYGEVDSIHYCWQKEGANKGQPAGYCFVVMKTLEHAQNVIQTLNGRQWRQRTLKVSEFEDRERIIKPSANESVVRNTSRGDKIKQLERKLAQLESFAKN